ncbi:MAG TPA: helix-turn-helix domain-containing protein [Candidatus Mediterraneibacter colneyensis]|nr:helix-turn-helix domain-containing protein [Candidatus Mediterraneibacter colneyensis]
MALGDNIKKLREERQLTQQQLADTLYVSRQTVCRWENGTRCPDLIMAKRLAAEFGISLDELISDQDLEELSAEKYPFHTDRIKRRKQLEEKQKRILEFIQIVGGIVLLISVFCRVQLEIRVPVWCFLIALCAEAAAFAARYRISRELDRLY